MKFLKYLALLVGFSAALPTFGFVAFGRTISIGLVSSALYFIVLLAVCSNKGVKFNKVTVLYGEHIWLPLLYTLILTATNIIYSNISTLSHTEIFPFSYFLCFVLFLALLYHSLLDHQGPTYTLYGFLVGTVVLALCFYLNIGVDINYTGTGGLDERFSVFGVNCNGLGLYCSLGFLVLLNEFILRKKISFFVLIVEILIGLLLVSMVFATASRSAFLALALGLALIVLFYPTKRKSSKVLVLIAGLAVLVVTAQFLSNSDLFLIARLYDAVETGDTSNRIEIINSYFPYVWEHPIFGVGNAGLIDVSKAAFGNVLMDDFGGVSAVSPHNVLLECALTTGLIGLLIMLLFWFHAGRCAYKQYKYYKRSTPVVIMCCIVISIIFAHILIDKLAWIIYAYMIGCKMPKKSTRSVVIPSKLANEKY